MIARLRSADGHTLPELLTALMMSMVILLATFALLDHVLKRTGETQARVEATPEGPHGDGHDHPVAALVGLHRAPRSRRSPPPRRRR